MSGEVTISTDRVNSYQVIRSSTDYVGPSGTTAVFLGLSQAGLARGCIHERIFSWDKRWV